MTPLMQYGARSLFRDKMAFFFAMIFPIVMTFFLGNMLSNYDNPDSSIDAIGIAWTEGTAGSAESESVAAFMDALKDNDNLKFTGEKNADAAMRAVKDGRCDVAMIFGSPLDITVYEGKDAIKNRAVALIAQSFSREYAAYATAAQADSEAFAQRMAKQTEGATSGLPESKKADDLTEDRDLGVNRSMMDFYAVTMIVMIAFMGGGIGGASEMYFLRKNGVMRRLTLSPTKHSRIFLDNVVGVIPQNILQAIVMMIPCVLIFGAHYAKTPTDNLLLFAYFVVLGSAVTALFMLVGLFIKANPMLPLMAAMWILLFISGTFNREINIPGLTEYLPMNIAQQAAFDLTLFGRPERVLTVMIVCAGILAVSCVCGSLVLKRKEIAL